MGKENWNSVTVHIENVEDIEVQCKPRKKQIWIDLNRCDQTGMIYFESKQQLARLVEKIDTALGRGEG